MLAQREFADADADLVVKHRRRRVQVPREVAEMRVRVETPQVRRAEPHQDLVRRPPVPGLLQLHGLQNGVVVWVVPIHPRQYLFHFDGRTRSPRDGSSRPFRVGLLIVAPVLFERIPLPLVLQPQRLQAQCRCINPPRDNGPDEAVAAGVVSIRATGRPRECARARRPTAGGRAARPGPRLPPGGTRPSGCQRS